MNINAKIDAIGPAVTVDFGMRSEFCLLNEIRTGH
jgi:hypothetical protein